MPASPAVLLCALLSAAAAAAPLPERPRLVVLDLTPAGGLDPSLAAAMTQALTAEVDAAGIFDVASSAELQTLVGVERQRQMLGCAAESSCLAELAGAMGARFVMSGSLARLGGAYQLTLQTLDTARAQPLGRSTHIARDLEVLRGLLPSAVAQATATPPPAPPSPVLPLTLVVAGAVGVGVGGVTGFTALSEEAALARELARGEEARAALKPLPAYVEDAARLSRQKSLALLSLGAGVALAGTGALLWSGALGGGGGRPSPGPRLSVVPAPGGAALVGVWP